MQATPSRPTSPSAPHSRGAPMGAAVTAAAAATEHVAPAALPLRPTRWERWAERDLQWTILLHRTTQYRVWQALLVTVSRLGDGGFWYALGLWLMYVGGPARDTAWKMVAAGVVNLMVYAVLKRVTGRDRPYVHCGDIKACARALDTGSFPSGHTMHAVCFSIIAGTQFPLLGLTLAPFVLLTAVSRVVLGLHYPSDVAAGASIGAFMAAVALMVF
ncbi:MAG: phosphoesterase PA-phosphatase related [Rhizobacter sp.]|nr:phosphoesterase PA-phosphatase related [Rhizobacter sp.]